MNRLYQYKALDTCATDSLCYVKCPLHVDTGKLVKELRHESHSAFGERVAVAIARNMGAVTLFMRYGLTLFYWVRLLFGKRLFGSIATALHKISGGLVPLWNQYFPKGTSRGSFKSSQMKSISSVES